MQVCEHAYEVRKLLFGDSLYYSLQALCIKWSRVHHLNPELTDVAHFLPPNSIEMPAFEYSFKAAYIQGAGIVLKRDYFFI